MSDGRESENGDGDPFEQLPDDGGEEDPFAELDLGERTPASDEAFEEMDVTDDGEEEWEHLLGGESDLDEQGEVGTGTVSNEATVPKGSYCESCEYLSSPPRTACEHPGGEIVEMVDMDHFRVRNCPVVAERRDEEEGPISGLEGDD